MNIEIAAYIAGVVDGEGCIRIGKFPTKRTPHGAQYRVIVEITMCEKETIEFVAQATQRSIQIRILPSGKTAYKIVWYNSNANALLESILPFLRGKRTQAEACIQCHTMMPGRGRSLTAENITSIEKIRAHVRWLKSAESLRC
jgi:hypothetical protein